MGCGGPRVDCANNARAGRHRRPGQLISHSHSHAALRATHKMHYKQQQHIPPPLTLRARAAAVPRKKEEKTQLIVLICKPKAEPKINTQRCWSWQKGERDSRTGAVAQVQQIAGPAATVPASSSSASASCNHDPTQCCTFPWQEAQLVEHTTRVARPRRGIVCVVSQLLPCLIEHGYCQAFCAN